MAEVYRARLGGIAGFAKTVVIKRLHPRHADQREFVQLFVEEAKLAAEVQHKNVVNVFDLGSLETGEVYMAMEYIAGTDLKNLLRTANTTGRRVPPWLSVHVVAEVLEALAFAHDLRDERGNPRNIVHCDVTPENVFLGRSGEVKLGDFGVARDDSRVSEAFEGSIRGKVPYMSPEQVQGHKPDRRTDVFSAGIVLWECLTQRRLFSAPEHPETVRKILFAPRIPPSHLIPDIPPQLDRIVLDALAVDQDARLQDARTMQRALLDVLEELRPRRTLTDVREGLQVLLPAPSSEPAAAPEGEIIDLGSDAILEDEIDDTATSWRPDASAERRRAREALAQPSALREVQSRIPSSTPRGNPSSPRVVAPRSNISQPRVEPPASNLSHPRLEAPSYPRVEAPRSNPSYPRVEAPRSNPSYPRLVTSEPPPSARPPRLTSDLPSMGREPSDWPRDTGDLEPGWVAHAAWLALGGDPDEPPPRMPPPRAVAPIRSPPGGVETRDILRRTPTRHPVPARPSASSEALLPGAPVPAEPPPRVDSSADRHPLWVRAPGGAVLGPYGPVGAIDAMRSLLDGAPAPTVAISADRRRWLDCDRLAPLLGEAPTAEPRGLAAVDGVTNLEQYSLTSLFGHLARSAQSGRLVVERASARGPVRWELSLDGGRLLNVTCSTEPFEIWSRALGAGASHGLKAVLHRVLSQIQPLSTVATPDDLEALKPHRVQALQTQLHGLFSEDRGRLWLETDASPPASLGAPIGLLRLLPAIVSRARRSRELRRDLSAYMESPLVRAEHFEEETRFLELPPEDQARLAPFGRGQTLAQSLASCRTPRDEKLALVLGYLLVQLGLLTPYYSQQSHATGSRQGEY